MRYLLAVSGGPDSMLLLYQYQKKDIVVAHVNYQKRAHANKEEKYVKTFCKQHQIPFFSLKIHDKVEEVKIKNFQNWAREKRYNFFVKIYYEQKCTILLLAHHKDDFLETYFLQKNKKKIVFRWGIQKEIRLKNMLIKRPFLDLYWKRDILNILKKNKIRFFIDESNLSNVYQRNIIRKKLQNTSWYEKNNLWKKIQIKNIWLLKHEKNLDQKYKLWKLNNFSFEKLNHHSELIIYELIFKLIHKNYSNDKINISKKKLTLLRSFIFGIKTTSAFLLKNNVFLIKKRNILYKESDYFCERIK